MVLVILIVLITTVHSGNEYCDMPCDGKDHTLCKYAEGGADMCRGSERGLSLEQKVLILDYHNEMRQTVALGKLSGQPSASNMMMLAWDDEAATIAQRWADQCQMDPSAQAKDECRTTKIGEVGGQNVAVELTETPRPDISGLLKSRMVAWFNDGVTFQPQWVDRFKLTDESDEYAQMVWALNNGIGCGLSYNESDYVKMYRLVCNYYPTGFIVDGVVYKKGLACSECPGETECSKQWPGLCTTFESDKGGILPNDTINTEASASVFGLSQTVLFTSVFLAVFYDC